MKAYSPDLRERVLGAVDQGMPQEEIAKVFALSLATIKRYVKQRRETGTVVAKPIPGRTSKKLVPLQLGLSQQLAEAPDATLAQHCQMWEQSQNIQVSPSTMSRAIKRLGWTRKKRRWERPNGTKPNATRGERR